MPTKSTDDLDREIEEAQAALMASLHALRTHGHQGITWALYDADRQRLTALRAQRVE